MLAGYFLVSIHVCKVPLQPIMAAAQIKTCEYTVLLVDGDHSARGEVGALLRRGGYQTQDFVRATDLLAAPDHVFQWSCIVSELSLPDMTGIELVRSLRDRAIPTPVIVLTAEADVPTAVHALRNDVADFLLKPIVERELMRRVETALVRHVARRDAIR